MRILISNDDGVHAPGIHALAAEFSREHDVTIVAPEREKSTTGHHLTLHKPLRIGRLAPKVYWVSGGPADCIHLGLEQVLKGKRPDLILSGINRGANLGQDVFYSGTASAAREGANQGVPSVAVSLCMDFHRRGAKENFAVAARMTRRVVEQTLGHFGGKKTPAKNALRSWPPGMMLNINVPNLPLARIKGIRAATQGYREYGTKILRRQDARGRDYFWIGGTYEGYRDLPDSDCWFVDHGYVAVTPLELDTTMTSVHQDLTKLWGKR